YYYDIEIKFTPLFNLYFLSSIVFILSFAWIAKLHFSNKHMSTVTRPSWLPTIAHYGITAILLMAIYFSITVELNNFWNQKIVHSFLEIQEENYDYPNSYYNFDFLNKGIFWKINFTL